jgi:hypothetical protein
MSSRHIVCAFVMVLPLAACKKKAENLDPYTGALTGERILGAKDLVKPFDVWDHGLAKLQHQLGKPTRILDKKYGWAVIEGDKCTYVYVEQEEKSKYSKDAKPGELMVGAVLDPMAIEKSGAMMNYGECLKIAGKEVGPPEDPNAPAPPTDGSAVTLERLRDLGIKGRTKWKDQRVKVEALFSNSTTASAGSVSTTTLSRVAKQGDADSTGCVLVAGQPTPGAMQYTPITVEGKVTISEWMSGGGESKLSIALEDCKVVALAADGGP